MVCVFPYLRAVNNPNEFSRVFGVMSIVENKTFSIDEQVRLWGWTNDLARAPSKADGAMHYFPVKAPALAYYGVPAYFVFSKVVGPALGHRYPTEKSPEAERLWWLRGSTWALRLWAVQIPCFLFALFLERYLRDFVRDPALRYTSVVAGLLGTNFLAYTNIYASHTPYAIAAFVSFALIERELRLSRGDARRRRPSRAFLAGLAAGACVAYEYQSLFVAVVLALFGALVFWRPTRLAAFALGGLLNVPGVAWFHWRAFGNPLTPGHKLLENQSFAAVHHKGLFGIVWPTWDHIKPLAVDPGAGFFGLSPFMWLGLVGVPILLLSPFGTPSLRRAVRVATIVWVLACAMLFGVNAGFVEWRGGWTVGPRYLVPCGPFFAFGSALALERLAGHHKKHRAAVRGLAGGLALASVLSVGTVGLLFDTLPEAMARPFAQFAVPLIRTGFVPHHVGQWVGWGSSTFWYVACGAMLASALLAGLVFGRDGGVALALRAVAFAVALGVGLVPALSKPDDGSALFAFHPSVKGWTQIWEPQGRDRITVLREQAERYGPRRPCMWHRIATLQRVVGEDAKAAADEKRAAGFPAERCSRFYF